MWRIPVLLFALAVAACSADSEEAAPPDGQSSNDDAGTAAAPSDRESPPEPAETVDCVTPPYGTPPARVEDIRPPCDLVESVEAVQSEEEALAKDTALIAESQG